MKFNEERWRTLAENKPDELHSYIPQSSICELFDEIERLEREIAKCKEANEDAQSRLDDYRQDYAKVVNDLCPTDERHCGCVPILRRENRLISEELADAKDELKHLDCRIAQLEKENARLTAENERLSQLLHDEISQLEIATDLGNKRWIALNQIYEDGEKHNANWCKRKAQEGLGIKNA